MTLIADVEKASGVGARRSAAAFRFKYLSDAVKKSADVFWILAAANGLKEWKAGDLGPKQGNTDCEDRGTEMQDFAGHSCKKEGNCRETVMTGERIEECKFAGQTCKISPEEENLCWKSTDKTEMPLSKLENLLYNRKNTSLRAGRSHGYRIDVPSIGKKK